MNRQQTNRDVTTYVTKVYLNGDRYEGSYKYNQKDSKGTFFYNDGDKYKGETKNNLKEGK